MATLNMLFDTKHHTFSDSVDGHDAMALQIQVVVAHSMLGAAERKVRREERRLEWRCGKGNPFRVCTPTPLPSYEWIEMSPRGNG